MKIKHNAVLAVDLTYKQLVKKMQRRTKTCSSVRIVKINGKNPEKHSAFWHKCPTHIEMQKKMKKTIPFYQKN